LERYREVVAVAGERRLLAHKDGSEVNCETRFGETRFSAIF